MRPLDATVAAALDLVPSRGSVAVMASRLGEATVVATDGLWINSLDGCKPNQVKITAKRRLVEVTSVAAPNFVIPELKKRDGSKVCFADFGPTPFRVPVPLTMLAPHIPNPAAAAATAGPNPAAAAATTDPNPAAAAATTDPNPAAAATTTDPNPAAVAAIVPAAEPILGDFR